MRSIATSSIVGIWVTYCKLVVMLLQEMLFTGVVPAIAGKSSIIFVMVPFCASREKSYTGQPYYVYRILAINIWVCCRPCTRICWLPCIISSSVRHFQNHRFHYLSYLYSVMPFACFLCFVCIVIFLAAWNQSYTSSLVFVFRCVRIVVRVRVSLAPTTAEFCSRVAVHS